MHSKALSNVREKKAIHIFILSSLGTCLLINTQVGQIKIPWQKVKRRMNYFEWINHKDAHLSVHVSIYKKLKNPEACNVAIRFVFYWLIKTFVMNRILLSKKHKWNNRFLKRNINWSSFFFLDFVINNVTKRIMLGSLYCIVMKNKYNAIHLYMIYITLNSYTRLLTMQNTTKKTKFLIQSCLHLTRDCIIEKAFKIVCYYSLPLVELMQVRESTYNVGEFIKRI